MQDGAGELIELKLDEPFQITPPNPIEADKKAIPTRSQSARDIFRFDGEKPTAINLEHVTQITREGKRITFQFYNTAMFVDFEEDEAAQNAFNQIITVWCADVLE